MAWKLDTVRKHARTSSAMLAEASGRLLRRNSSGTRMVGLRDDDEEQADKGTRVTPASVSLAPVADLRAHAGAQASDRYSLYGEIASGGMAVVHYGRLEGPGGFARSVAIKQLHPQFARDPNFVSMFLDEARLAARIAHANVVPTLDVLHRPNEVSVIMEYVPGESLSGLLTLANGRGTALPVRIATTLLAGTLHGLHAAHETRGEHDELLGIVHRDVSPQNILVGADGVARLLDFGIAKAQGRSRVTPTGELKGKLAYMACEQYRAEELDRRVDVYGAAVVLWEALTGRLLFDGPNDAAVARAVLNDPVSPPSTFAADVPPALDAIVMRGLSRDRSARYNTAREMALALEREVGVVTQSEVVDWLRELAGDLLDARAEKVRMMQRRGEARSITPVPEDGTRRIDSSAQLVPVAATPLANPVVPLPRAEGPESHPNVRSEASRWLRVVPIALVLMAASLAAYLFMGRAADEHPPPLRVAPAAIEKPAVVERSAQAPKPVSEPSAPVAAPEPVKVEAVVREEKKTDTTSVPRESKKSRPKKVDCSDPFMVDELGIKRVRRECL